MLKQADFSKETDLKERLHSRLFSRQVVGFPGARAELDEDMLDLVTAAGTGMKNDEKKDTIDQFMK